MAKLSQEDKTRLLKGIEEFLDNQTEFTQDSVNMLEVFPKLLKLQNDKGLVYGRSYCKHADTSIFFNLERKWDRISNIMERTIRQGTDTLYSEASSTPTETFLDTIADLATYSIMWVGYTRETHPDEYQKFLSANKL